jgi:hypothetical protein
MRALRTPQVVQRRLLQLAACRPHRRRRQRREQRRRALGVGAACDLRDHLEGGVRKKNATTLYEISMCNCSD